MPRNQAIEDLERIERPELVIGLVGAVGSRLEVVARALDREFSAVRYSTETIQLSELLEEIYGKPKSDDGSEFHRIKYLMGRGDDFRKSVKRKEAVALLSVAAIRRHREENGGGERGKSLEGDDRYARSNIPLVAHAYILRSLKTPEEIRLLRNIYGRAFFLVSAYSPRELRVDRLARKIAESYSDTARSQSRKCAEYLIERDEKDSQNKYGQNVQETFPLGDLFVNVESTPAARAEIRRFVRTLFGYQFHTPTREEFGMFHAMAASRRSADLSRQVGAAIATSDGDIIAVGCNEVPKAGGGMYWEGDASDERDYVRGYDSSHKEKINIVSEILGRLKRAKGWLSDEREKQKISHLVDELFVRDGAVLKGARIENLLEFGRIVHAEMAALMDALCRGVSVRNTTLFTTTFPCHMCARHLIAAGLDRVVYVEPYPKSMVKELYSDSVTIDGEVGEENAIDFVPFVGVAPRKYLELFEAPSVIKRKNNKTGKVIEWSEEIAQVRLERYVASYILIELRAENFIAVKLTEIMPAIRTGYAHGYRKSGVPIGDWLASRKAPREKLKKELPRWLLEVIGPTA